MRGDPPSLLLKLLVQSSRTLALCSRSCHLARDAQPINLRDRTHAATPEKFGAWPDKLVCLRPTFFFLLFRRSSCIFVAQVLCDAALLFVEYILLYRLFYSIDFSTL